MAGVTISCLAELGLTLAAHPDLCGWYLWLGYHILLAHNLIVRWYVNYLDTSLGREFSRCNMSAAACC